MRIKLLKFFNIFLIVCLAFFPFRYIDGMQSNNYAIEKDSINFSGTDDSESANYKLSDTMGEVGAGGMSEKCFSMNFDGVDDYVEVSHNAILEPGSVSISMWVKLNNDGNRHIVAAKWRGYSLEVSSGGLPNFQIYNSQGQFAINSSKLIQFNTWQYLVGTFDNSTKEMTISVNGNETGRRSLASSMLYSNTVLRISNTLYDDGAVNGLIDDTRIYNRVLSATEIEDLYKGNQIGNTGLVGYWGFDEGSGTTTADLSGNGNTGTISGATFSDDTPLATCSVLNAGYREMLPSYISMTDPADVVLSPDIGGVSGGTGDGSATWNVKTDGSAGYQVSVRAGTSPALKSGSDSFADYTPMTTGTPDFIWNIASTDSEFGYTVEGDNAIGKFLDNGGGACGVGSGNVADKCWFPFSTADSSIVNASSPNHPLGSDTTVKFKAQSGSGHLQPEGVYTATIVVTAVAL